MLELSADACLSVCGPEALWQPDKARTQKTVKGRSETATVRSCFAEDSLLCIQKFLSEFTNILKAPSFRFRYIYPNTDVYYS